LNEKKQRAGSLRSSKKHDRLFSSLRRVSGLSDITVGNSKVSSHIFRRKKIIFGEVQFSKKNIIKIFSEIHSKKFSF